MKVRNIALDMIDPPALMPRLREEDEQLQELASSMASHGLLNPLTVVPEGERFRLLAGRRRFQAAGLLGWKKVACNVVTLPEAVADEVTMVENLLRRNLSDVEQAYGLAMIKSRTGLSDEEIAARLGKERTYVTRRLALVDLDDNTLGAVEDEIITMSEALELRKIEDPEIRLRLIEHAQQYGCTLRVMRYWVQNYLKEQRAAEARGETAPGAEELEMVPPRQVMMPCDRCQSPTPYEDLRSLYVCPGCYTVQILERVRDSQQP